MDIHPDTSFEARITASHVYALSQGAVVTTPLLLSPEQYLSVTLKPGDEIDVQGVEHGNNQVHCRILDVESVEVKPEYVFVRLTLEKA